MPSPPPDHSEPSQSPAREVHRNLAPAQLYEHALRRAEGRVAASGPLVVETGEHTGRSPRDKYIVREPLTEDEVWWGEINQPLSPAHFATLQRDVVAHLAGREQFSEDLAAAGDPAHRLRVRVTSEYAWGALFAQNLFIVPTAAERDAASDLVPDFTVLHAPTLPASPERHGVRTETAIVISFAARVVLIVGTSYAGEIKKAMFTVLQFLLPRRGVATMHCSANTGADGDVALFFGLSGTGKTTLSTAPDRLLIGDDEHGWSDQGIFNFEGGSYAKVIALSAEAEPDIWRASHQFGTVLENVTLDPETRELDLGDDSLTENTRAAFPLTFFSNLADAGVAPHPRTIILLTADAFGVLPPVARLTPAQAHYWYLSGYTAKLAGTERGVAEPEATFSACFGAPFLPLPPERYASLLEARIKAHQPRLWLVNTGWSGGPPGVGERISIELTRAIVQAVVSGALDLVPTTPEPIFGLAIPATCPDVPSELLQPWRGWDDPAAYDRTARLLAARFTENFARYTDAVDAAVIAAGPNATPA